LRDEDLSFIVSVNSFSDKKQKVTFKYDEHPEIEALVKCKNAFYLTNIKMNEGYPTIAKSIEVTNQELIDLFENDRLVFANRIGEL